MAFISFGKCKKKNIFIIISIISSYFIFQTEYYSAFYYDCHNYDSPHLFSLYLSFSFLSSFIIGGIIYIIIERNIKKDNTNKSKEIKKEDSKKKSLDISLLYDEQYNEIYIDIKFFIFSTFLELLSNLFFYLIAFDFIDIESKMIFNGFEIIIIKMIGKILFKNQMYKHQKITVVILLILLIFGIIGREEYLRQIINDNLTINETIQNYIKEKFKKQNYYMIFFYLIYIVIGNTASSFSVCYDNWLMTTKLCSPYKLFFFKGFFGFIPAFLIQLILYFVLGERGKTKDEEINLINLIKRLSFPFSSFNSIPNTFIIFVFFLLVGVYQFAIIYTNNFFQPEFVGLSIIFASSLTIITNEMYKIYESQDRLFYLIPFFYFIITLITSLIICEIIILHFCGCDKNTASSIDKRASMESYNSFKKYIEEETKEEKVSFEGLSNDDSQED